MRLISYGSTDTLRLRLFLISDAVDKAGLDGPDEVPRQLGEVLSDILINGEFDIDGNTPVCGSNDKEDEGNKVDFTICDPVKKC